MSGALKKLRLAVDERKWLLWVMIATVAILAWFLVVALIPHPVVNTFQHYEEQANGLREAPPTVRTAP